MTIVTSAPKDATTDQPKQDLFLWIDSDDLSEEDLLDWEAALKAATTE